MKIPFGSTIVIAQGSYIPTLESIHFESQNIEIWFAKRTVHVAQREAKQYAGGRQTNGGHSGEPAQISFIEPKRFEWINILARFSKRGRGSFLSFERSKHRLFWLGSSWGGVGGRA